MKSDDLGDRMKRLEGVESARQLMPLLPVLARLDGRSFSRFTKHVERPFSKKLHGLMVDTTRFLLEESGALVGYTQSDEIQLAFYSSTYASQIFFDGKVQKMTSTLAALATAYFNKHGPAQLPGLPGWHTYPTFDCRVWNVPTLDEAANCFIWRQQDATRNSIQGLARCYLSHKQCHGLDTNQLQEALHAHGVNWNDRPPAEKRGTFVRKAKRYIRFTADEIERLPPKHEARQNPDLLVERAVIETLDLRLTQLRNRPEVLFAAANPEPAP